MTKPRGSTLRGRSIRSVYLFGSIMVLAYATVVLILLAKLEDRLMLGRLDQLAEQAILDLESDRVPSPMAGERLAVYVGVESLPIDLRPLFGNLDEGDHEIHEHFLFLDDIEHFVAVRRLPDSETRVFVYLASEAIEGVTLWWTPVVGSFVVGLVLVVLIAPWVGSRLVDGVVRPLNRLTSLVESSEPEELSDRLDAAGFTGEVGVLAEALGESADRCTEFAARERRFTRNASHELRSPVTVIRGATDLLRAQLRQDERAGARLGRIERSVDHMEEIIEAFLWLAREQESDPEAAIDLLPVVEFVVDNQRTLLPNRADDLRVESAAPTKVRAPESILRVVVGNLVANALRHSVAGTVVVEVTQGRLVVTDQGPGIKESSISELTKPFVTSGKGGQGLGLAIVDEICRRFDWRLEFGNGADGGTVTTLRFEVDVGLPTSRVQSTDEQLTV